VSLHRSSDDVFLTTEEVLDYLQVNVRTVYRLIKAGQLPAVRVGRLWRFRRSDIDAWLERQRPRHHADSGAPRARVLVVDDEPNIREMLARTLALAHYEVDTAPDAKTAIRMLRDPAGRCDLLVADLNLPDVDGLSLIREVKRFRAALPIIIITGFSTESSAIEAINLGVAGYLTKPFRVPQVLAAAAKAIGVPAA
jgi:excisionase family DNA binding protein